MVLRPIRPKDRHRRLRQILIGLGLLSICGAIIWIVGLGLGLFPSLGLLFDLDVEALFLLFTAFALGIYRVIRKGNEQQIRGLKIVGLIGGPFVGLGGLLAGLIATSSAGPDRIIAAGQSVLQFDAFLAVGWTIGFGILDRWSKELRETRRELLALERKGVREVGEVLRILAGKPAQAFGELMTSIVLFVFSGIVAVLTVLTGNQISLGGSIAMLLVGVGFMLVAWYEIYQSANFLENAREDLAKMPV